MLKCTRPTAEDIQKMQASTYYGIASNGRPAKVVKRSDMPVYYLDRAGCITPDARDAVSTVSSQYDVSGNLHQIQTPCEPHMEDSLLVNLWAEVLKHGKELDWVHKVNNGRLPEHWEI